MTYQKDLLVIVEFISEFLRYEEVPGVLQYPMYLESFAKDIIKMKTNDLTFGSERRRSLFTFYPATWTLYEQVAVFTNLMIKDHHGFLSEVDRY